MSKSNQRAHAKSSIPKNAYVPWFNTVALAGIVASQPYVHQWDRPGNLSKFFGIHFLLFSRIRGDVAGKFYSRHFMVAVQYMSTSPKYAPLLRPGQPVLVKGELDSYRTRDGDWELHVRCTAKPTLIWGRSGKHGVPEEFRSLVDEGVVGGEDFMEDILHIRGEPVPYGRTPRED